MSWKVQYQHTLEYIVEETSDVFDPANHALADVARMGPDVRQLVVVDRGMYDHWGHRVDEYLSFHAPRADVLVIDAVEEKKGIEAALRVAAAADEAKITRRAAPIVAVGGGVLSDIVGFASSIYRRGTPYVRVPTTLIGMVDASVGAKTAVNSRGFKNRLGTYFPSSHTVIDAALLSTLPRRHVSNGIAEILKMGMVGNPALLGLLEDHAETLVADRLRSRQGQQVMSYAIGDMLRELEPNLLEKDLRRLVDFGHTFSPALELADAGTLLHGEAVAVDMAVCTTIAASRGLVDEALLGRVLDLLLRFRLPAAVEWATSSTLWAGMEDAVRHRDGVQNFVIPVGFGRCDFVQNIVREEVDEAWEHLQTLNRPAVNRVYA